MLAKCASLFLTSNDLIIDCISAIDNSGYLGAAILVDENKKFLDIITDGDIRRALLKGFGLNDHLSHVIAIKRTMPLSSALTVSVAADRQSYYHVLVSHKVKQLPVIGLDGICVDLVHINDFIVPEHRISDHTVVIFAGGFGKRLLPLTENIPKPMLPVNGKPILELIINRFKLYGFTNFIITTHYKAEIIVDYFGNGEKIGVHISYIREDTPLGTGGALRLLPKLEHPFIVSNGDILTEINFETFIKYHLNSESDLTVAARKYEVEIPFGVLSNDNNKIFDVVEKPKSNHLVNAGMYVVNPELISKIPPGVEYNMTDLMRDCIKASHNVIAYPFIEEWIDVGRHNDYNLIKENYQ